MRLHDLSRSWSVWLQWNNHCFDPFKCQYWRWLFKVIYVCPTFWGTPFPMVWRNCMRCSSRRKTRSALIMWHDIVDLQFWTRSIRPCRNHQNARTVDVHFAAWQTPAVKITFCSIFISALDTSTAIWKSTHLWRSETLDTRTHNVALRPSRLTAVQHVGPN